MRDQRDAGGEKARVVGGAGISLRNSGANSPNTVETWTPTFSNTRPFIIAMTRAAAADGTLFPGCGAGRQAAAPSFQGALDGTLALSR